MGANSNKIPWDDELIMELYGKKSLKEISKVLIDKYGDSRMSAKNLSRHCINALKLSTVNKADIDISKFKVIPGYNDLYMINKEGDIYSTYTKSILREQIDKKGYPCVKAKVNGRHKSIYVHKALALCYIPNDDPINKTQVDHVDGNKLNHDLSNLEWVTCKENIQRARDIELNKSMPSRSTKTDDETVRDIYLYYKDHTDESYRSIGIKFSVSPNTVKRIVTKDRFKEVTDKLD